MSPEAFIARWTSREGGAERANYQMFLTEFCDVLGVARPDVAGAETRRNNYAFERAVRPRETDGGHAPKRIDLYKRDCFILEAKQSRLPGRKNELPEPARAQPRLFAEEPAALGRPSAARDWDVMMLNARRQAEHYVFLLDPDHKAPPFLIVCDVGHCLELYADFSGSGRAYAAFPDRKSFRIYLTQLRNSAARDLLKAVWQEPQSLDPALKAARVTREIARRLATVSRTLEAAHPDEAEAIAHFLMRCIFTMFADDVGLLPKGEFRKLLEDCVASPRSFAPMVRELWAKMDEKDHDKRFFSAFRTHVRHFNGNLFHNAKAYALEAEEIGELLAASRMDWREVDPAIFGALLEQALDPVERRRLGAHYTPRAYVQRLVDVAVMEPLRADWRAAQTKAESQKEAGDDRKAAETIRGFLKMLCATRILDPACGTGNFLYVALELMKALEGEALETLARLGEPESMGLDRETVDPHQFLGLERNPRAAAIAELVVWIGYLQQHYRTRTGHPGEPILRAFRNINFGRQEGYDAVLTWDGAPTPTVAKTAGGRVETYPNARRPAWPEAEFIVGNPPFIGGKDLRSRLGSSYAQALWSAHPHMNESADFVMYWWDRAAELLARDGSPLRRFGLVTTNSISQVFQRRVVERHLSGRAPISLVYAAPDHPWTKASRDAAAVRIAMTVAAKGRADGRVDEVVREAALDTDEPVIEFAKRLGRINADLSLGADPTATVRLLGNEGLCCPGVKLHGSGFIVHPVEAKRLGLGRVAGLAAHIRPYRNGRDLTSRAREVLAIDLYELTEVDVRRRFPEVYQHLLEKVRPAREEQARKSPTKDALSYRERWWLFGKPRPELRPALDGLGRYIATVETARHRIFQFLDASILPDNMLVVVADDDAATLAILSSRVHVAWALATGGWLGVGNDPRYSKSRCFDPFPFPELSPDARCALRSVGEELDALRKRVLSENPDLTLTGLYNVVEKLRARAALSAKEEDVKLRGLAVILRELHEEVDRLTLDAYGWPATLDDEPLLAGLVALNAERAREEAAGHVRWLRPAYQAPRFGDGAPRRSRELDLVAAKVAAPALAPFPADPYEQPLAVEAALAMAGRPLSAAEIAGAFRGGSRMRGERVLQALGTLARYGRVSALPDGRYAARRAA